MDKAICDDAAWRAVMRRSKAHDGQFYTGVLSTGIYCRPSCAARHPKRENVRFFASYIAAEQAGLRACKRCHPRDIMRDARAIKTVIAMIKAAPNIPKLKEMSDDAGYSPSHLQRIFKREVGLSPSAYARAIRAKEAGDTLAQSQRVSDAIYDAGYQSPSRFYAENKGRLGMKPSIWQNGGAGAHIHWTIVDTYLGSMLVAATDKGVCRLSFNEGEEALQARFPKARLDRGGADFAAVVKQVVDAVERPGAAHNIALDVQGTAFQEAVWQQLQAIPPGETCSYAELAAAVGRPKAYRAAGSANGANNIAVLIPCHRVVASDGSLGGYAYGLEIKQKLIDAEKAHKS
jgi:AraC family transcriptional regulator of adaptative response/methylated-DNA-[protein]-cysteine methyltransferase